MKSVLIVGYGIVGHNLSKELAKLKADIYDKFKPEVNTKQNKKYDFCFICVDTPYVDQDNLCDISQVKAALQENDADIYIIKSTILPGTTESLSKEFNKHIVFSPEYYGGTQHCNNFSFDFTILGGDKKDCCEVQQLLQEVYDARHVFRLVEPKEAELTKYMENTWIGYKVDFMVQFKLACDKLGIDYETVRELHNLDPRFSPCFTYVYDEHPYWDSHCTNKDIRAIAYYLDLELIKDMIKFNDKQKGVIR